MLQRYVLSPVLSVVCFVNFAWAQDFSDVAQTIYAPETTPFSYGIPYLQGIGLDGRLYTGDRYNGNSPVAMLALGPDGGNADYFYLSGVNPYGQIGSSFAGVNYMQSDPALVSDSAGRMYGQSWPIPEGTYPDGTNYGPTAATTCPMVVSYREAIGQPYQEVGKFYGAIYWYNERNDASLIAATENLCPVGPMVVDAEDNLYFFSMIGRTYGGENELGQRLYKLSADHQVLTLVYEFPKTDMWLDNINYYYPAPVSLIMDSSGEWLYGVVGRLRSESATLVGPRLFKIGKDGSGFQVLKDFNDIGGLGWVSEIVVFEKNGLIYGNLGNVIYRIEKDGSNFEVLYTGASIQTAHAVAALVPGSDGNLYASHRGAEGVPGSLFRIVLDKSSGAASTEILWQYTAGGHYPKLYFASEQGKVYGMDYATPGADRYASSRIFALDTGSGTTAPIIYLWSDHPEVSPGEDGSLPANAVHWRVENLGSGTCSSEWAGSGLAAEGQAGVEVSQSGRNVYTLTCDNGTQSSSRSISIYSSAAPVAAEIVSFSASAASVQMNQSVTLSWQVSNALTCTGSGEDTWSGAKSFDSDGKGSQTLTVAEKSAAYDASYVLTCKGGGGNDSRTVTVAVSTPPGTVAHSGGALAWLLLPLALAVGLRRRGRQGWLI